MKIILKIAFAELKKLFYSPVAWFILVIFAFQTALNFTGAFDVLIKVSGLGAKVGGATNRIYGGRTGIFGFFAAYAYIYMPLVTMGIMSREISTGSIKLLYSSPITNWQIILGKYLSLMVFGLTLIGFMIVFTAFGALTIVHADIPPMLGGLLGLYLLICAYAAIGLFVSTLTSYIVVAAIGTVGVFALLNYVGGIGQDILIVRDITYWFSISGRVNTFLSGMITSEDVLYFFIVIVLFLLFTLIKLQAGRQKINWTATAGKYLAVLLGAMLLGYFSATPKLKFYKDLTYTKVNTLSENSQRIITKVPDNTVITTYTNMLSNTAYSTTPSNYKGEEKLFENYLRFNPTLKLKYVYFYHKTDNAQLERLFPNLNDIQRLDTLRNNMDWNFKILPYNKITDKVDLASDNYRSIRVIETPDGKKTFLRFFDDYIYIPTEAEISASFKHLIKDVPTIGFLTGHGERSTSAETDESYSIFTKDIRFRNALINQGIDFENITLDKPIPQKIRILVIADVKNMLTATEQKNLDNYITGGGNMMILGEPGKQNIMNSITAPLGVRFLPGTLAHNPGAVAAESVKLQSTDIGRRHISFLKDIDKQYKVMIMTTATGLEADNNKGFRVLPWLTTEADSCWSELQTPNIISNATPVNSVFKIRERQSQIIKTGNTQNVTPSNPNGVQPNILINGKMVDNIAITNPDRRIHPIKATDPNVAVTKPDGSIKQEIIKVVAAGTFNAGDHEVKKPYTTVMSLERIVGKKQQKIIIIGDADWLDNGELHTMRDEPKANSILSNGMFSWLCDGEAPVDISRPRPIDIALKINKHGWAIYSPVLKWLFPGLLILTGIIIWIRRKGR